MKKTIKIIDLLNKIANDEEVPKKIEIDETIYQIVNPCYTTMYKDYSGNELEDNIHYLTRHLNDEVEIIEEDKKIEKLDIEISSEDGITITSVKDEFKKNWCLATCERILANKINEIIDAINELKGKSE